MNTAPEVSNDLEGAPGEAPHNAGDATGTASSEPHDLVRLQQFLDKHAPEDSSPQPRRASRNRRRNTRNTSRNELALSLAPAENGLSLAAHQARCSICCDPEREAIEEEFVHWHNTRHIARDYDLDRRAIYRHAHALNLFTIRDRNLRYALGHIIEHAERVASNAPSVIRAVRSFTCVNDEGRWIEPPAQVIVSSGSRPVASPPRQSQTHAQFEVIEHPALAPRGRRKSVKKRRRSPDNGSRSKPTANR